TPSSAVDPVPTGVPSTTEETSGIFPPSTDIPPSGTSGASDTLSETPTDIPVSETRTPTETLSEPTNDATEAPTTTATPPPTSDAEPPTSTLDIPFVPSVTSTTSRPPIASVQPTATNTETALSRPTEILREPSTASPPSSTSTGIPSDLPRMIPAPPNDNSYIPSDMFLGQIGFEWPLNWPFVCRSDGGTQIFEILPIAIAYALNITQDKIFMQGLKPFDTTEYQRFITTLAQFYIPADLSGTLAGKLRVPADDMWFHPNSTIREFTSLINTAFPLSAGGTSEEVQNPILGGSDGDGETPGVAAGGAIGADMGASRKVNPTSAGIATGAVMGALAYGAAMFFVARRYRTRKLSHKRTSSVPTTNRRYTYGSLQGGAFMSGARGPGRFSFGGRDSRGSRGSSSSQGRSVRTQQISAPVMAENSLGWN
ncbi:hypothetical protein M011DRAFT_374965, partial [Sporormia fimetaria CBS 119925]